jgi:hypothetical protein
LDLGFWLDDVYDDARSRQVWSFSKLSCLRNLEKFSSPESAELNSAFFRGVCKLTRLRCLSLSLYYTFQSDDAEVVLPFIEGCNSLTCLQSLEVINVVPSCDGEGLRTTFKEHVQWDPIILAKIVFKD